MGGSPSDDFHQHKCVSVSEKSERPKLQLHHGPIEIERKFLVANGEWRQSAVRSVGIRSLYTRTARCGFGYPETSRRSLSRDRGSALYARSLNIDTIVDAERMLSTMCQDDTLEKQRFLVEDAGATWHVDVYGGILQGVVIAEIELKQEGQELTFRVGLARK